VCHEFPRAPRGGTAAITSMTRFKSDKAGEMVKTAKQAKIGVDL
jgi:hypothetical protein